LSVESGFDEMQVEVNAPKDAMEEARRRRDVFVTSAPKAEDVTEAWPSGSLARGTQKDPIHDVDVVVVFNKQMHPAWGDPGDSAVDALEHTRGLVKELLGSDGTEGVEVRLTRLHNHAVKCFLDDPDAPNPFTVDVTPALPRSDGGIWIPEQFNERWIASDPKYLMARVAERHAAWNQFAKLVRVLKRWGADNGRVMKPLVIEVLALDHLPALARPDALARFFTAAADAVWSPVCDPADLCGEIQPDLDRQLAHDLLDAAADTAWRAVDAAGRGHTDKAMCLWHKLFVDIYPEAPGGCDGGGQSGIAAVPLVRPKRPIVDAPQG
jgi:hypothetical protein